MLALPPIGDWVDEGPVVFSGIAPFRQKTVQNAGRSFFDRYEFSGFGNEDGEDDDDGSQDGPATVESGQKKKKPVKERDNALKLPDMLKGVDLYALMESDDSASPEDLKKSYRKLCLTHHPDKQTQPLNDKAKEEMNQRFLKLQEAYEILSDTKKRRKYDSMGSFDDSVPSTLKKGQDFFVVFGEAFRRNAKWSERKPVPDIGDAALPFEKVERFYDFWRGFQSWRELDEQIMKEEGEDCFMNLEDAECREERRWMERQNGKLREKARKDERARIARLVENAEKLDPRVLAEKERKRLVREAEKDAKDAKRASIELAAREELERKAAIEREQEEARKAEKAKKDEDRQVKKLARAALRKQVNDLNLNIYDDQLQEFLLALEPSQIEELSKSLSMKKKNNKADGESVLQAMRDKGMDPIIRKVAAEERSTTEGSASEAEEVDPVKKAEAEKLAKEKKKEQIRKAEERDVELKRIREEEAALEAENKKIRDAKKKVENEKKDQERRKAEKKAVEAAKKQEEKKRKALEAAEAKALADKLENQRLAEEQKAQAQQNKEEAREAQQLEETQMQFERDRLARLEALEKLEWSAVIELSREACASPKVASALAAAKGREGEELLDAQLACLGSVFVVGVRLSPESPGVSSTLRNRMKKLRAKLRASAASGELFLEPAAGIKKNAATLEQLLRIGVGLEMEVAAAEVSKANAVDEANAGGETPAAKKKAKAKAKAAPEEEDLDSLLAEFGCDTSAKKPKKKNKK